MLCSDADNPNVNICDIETSLGLSEHKPKTQSGEYITILIITLVILYGASKL